LTYRKRLASLDPDQILTLVYFIAQVEYDFPSFKKENHMHKMLKIVASVAVGTVLASSAFAATQAVYFDAKTGPAVSAPNYLVATLTNYTNSLYMSYSSNLPSHLSADMPLGRYGSSTSSIQYNIVYPDNVVCMDVVRSDGYVVWFGCLAGGNYGIYDSAANSANAKPIVRAVK
jgi:hypothetical protein